MSEKILLRGITWNHPRGYASIQAVSEAFSRLHPQVEFSWDIRSLKDFGDYPVTSLAQRYDLILMDHPHIGSAVRAGALLPLDEWMDEAFLADQKDQSVGKSFESYCLDGHPWALAVDAAAQVSAYRPDLMERQGYGLPADWEQVYELAKKSRGGSCVGFPLCETDVYCSFLSIGANRKGDDFFDQETGPDHEAALYAVEVLSRLSQVVHPESLHMNPIQMLDRMADTDEIAYVPLLFGYSNYARTVQGRRLVRFANIPSDTAVPSGALLGGVGLAISSKCREPELAVAFGMYAADGQTQRGVYYQNAGQPGYLGAWVDEAVNADCHGFFKDTLDTLRHSYLRPRYEGYNAFQEQAGVVLHDGLMAGKAPEAIVEELETLFAAQKRRWG